MALVAPRPIHLAVLARKACACEVEEAGGRETGAALALALAPVRPAFALIRLSAKLIEVAIVVPDKTFLSRSLFALGWMGFSTARGGTSGEGRRRWPGGGKKTVARRQASSHASSSANPFIESIPLSYDWRGKEIASESVTRWPPPRPHISVSLSLSCCACACASSAAHGRSAVCLSVGRSPTSFLFPWLPSLGA